MATTIDRSPHQVQVHTTTTTQRYDQGGVNPTYRYEGGSSGVRSLFSDRSGGGPSTTHVVAIVAGVPIGGTLLFLAGLSLMASLIGLAIATPVFIIFSPVLVPAVLTISLAVAGVLTSGACGLMGLMSFSWVMNYMRQIHGTVPEQLDYAKRRLADAADYVGQKTKETGQDIQTKAQDVKRT